MTRPNLEQMSVFVAVAEAGSFTAAADRLGMAKSAVSQAVSSLERELGVQLLQRSTRKLAITETGAAFCHDCVELLARAAAAVDRVRTGKAQPTGILRITSVVDSAPMVAEWIAEYCARYPAMRIEYLPTDQKIDLIAERFDLALRIGSMQDSSLRAVKLGELETWLVAAPDYLARRGTPRTPQDLVSHEWIALTVVPTPWTRVFESPSGRQERVRLSGAISVSAAAAMRSLVVAGAGIAAFPDSMVRADLAAGRMKRLLANYRLPKLFLYAVYPGSRAVPAKTRSFIDIAKARLGMPGTAG
ncbi:LysR family transcriptional regulator [Sulfuritalea sp.]|uniref:LysR family transcriptional regulator n=1 Tax=Sulfuritalea sp. TaxID=2480090 RepID=UPI00286DB268|nr:LysR family transcriptional regulator [Sulfuritalea sp.]